MLLVTFIGHYVINLSIYCLITLIVVGISFGWMNHQKEDPGICAVVGLISWMISIVSFAFIGDPELDSSTIARTFGTITAITANVMFILPPLVKGISNIPSSVKERRARRKTIKVEVKVKQRHISDL